MGMLDRIKSAGTYVADKARAASSYVADKARAAKAAIANKASAAKAYAVETRVAKAAVAAKEYTVAKAVSGANWAGETYVAKKARQGAAYVAGSYAAKKAAQGATFVANTAKRAYLGARKAVVRFPKSAVILAIAAIAAITMLVSGFAGAIAAVAMTAVVAADYAYNKWFSPAAKKAKIEKIVGDVVNGALAQVVADYPVRVKAAQTIQKFIRAKLLLPVRVSQYAAANKLKNRKPEAAEQAGLAASIKVAGDSAEAVREDAIGKGKTLGKAVMFSEEGSTAGGAVDTGKKPSMYARFKNWCSEQVAETRRRRAERRGKGKR